MSWTVGRTWVTGEIITASLFNTYIRDDLNHVYGSISTFTPTVSQPTAVTATTAVGRYRHVGYLCWLHIFFDSGGTGTGLNGIVIGAVPAAVAPRVSAAAFSSTGECDVGRGFFFDSGTALYRCLVPFISSSTLALYESAGITNNPVGIVPNLAIATADSLGLTIAYETSSASS